MNDEYLSEHTISMRAALRHCQELLSSLDEASSIMPSHLHETALDAWNAAQSISTQQDKALKDITIIDFEEDMSVLDFRKEFLHCNRPCLIRGMLLDRSKHFSHVTSQWRTPEFQVNREWFQKHLGDETIVPVRQQSTATELDNEGRAKEWSTVNMTMREWCQTTDSPHLYLKDWHFQKWWEQQYPNEPLLYSVPLLFRNDLLNKLLLKYTKGDYRFVYWGPPGSETPLHSDVLHSFSWSFNVVGEKKWTFYVPKTRQEIVVVQQAGEMVFVPSTWTHKVENLSETLSINHNWITTASIDYTWECILAEIAQVDRELGKWNEVSSWDAKEFMLRGCVGLDVTAFFFIIITELMELLTCDTNRVTDEECWEYFFDLFRLCQVLERLLEPDVHLQERMSAVLEQDSLAFEAMNVSKVAKAVMNEIRNAMG